MQETVSGHTDPVSCQPNLLIENLETWDYGDFLEYALLAH
jgi:hypothetical protein